MPTKISFKLDAKDIRKAIKQIENYKKGLPRKCQLLSENLADYGIMVAWHYSGDYHDVLRFEKKVEGDSRAVRVVVYASYEMITRYWQTQDGVKSAVIDPLLMAEFGSGAKASDASGKPNADLAHAVGAGRGTFPGQTHADQPEWMWQDIDGEWHSSSGEEPSMPVWNAYNYMKDKILYFAKGAFS